MGSKKDWKKTKTIYWKDEVNDDFDEVGLKRPGVPENYKYKRTNFINNFFSGILYHGIAKPFIGLYCFFKGIKIKGRENIKKLGGKGAFIFSNHVAISDVFKFQAYVFFFGKRVNIIGYSDSLSMPVVRHLTRALGYLPLPLPGDVKNMIALMDSMKFYIEKKQYILIYPEAHIWPYYTKIRNFHSGSFNYPARLEAPVLPVVTTWRKSKLCKKPKQTLYILEPIYPDPEKTSAENKEYLYEETLRVMKECSESVPQYEYIKYIKVENDNDKKE